MRSGTGCRPERLRYRYRRQAGSRGARAAVGDRPVGIGTHTARHVHRGRTVGAPLPAHVRLRRRSGPQGIRLRDRETLRGLAGIGVGHRHRVGTAVKPEAVAPVPPAG